MFVGLNEHGAAVTRMDIVVVITINWSVLRLKDTTIESQEPIS